MKNYTKDQFCEDSILLKFGYFKPYSAYHQDLFRMIIFCTMSILVISGFGYRKKCIFPNFVQYIFKNNEGIIK